MQSNRPNLRSVIAGVTLTAIAVGGCATPAKNEPAPSATLNGASTPTAPISNTDACATRLQDICGGLLLYYQLNQRLPQSLSEIKAFPGEEAIGNFECPVSKLPYVYVPNGIFLPEKNARIIIYDAAPSHSNLRWAISIDEPQADRPLVTKVIALPESFFLFRR